MTIIPVGYSQHTYLFSGSMLPFGAAVTMGINHGGTANIAEEGEDAADDWVEHIMPHLASALTFTGVIVKRGPNATGPQYVASRTALGGQGVAGMTPNVAYLVRKNTALGGRRHRGRMYLPGVIEANVGDSGQLLLNFRQDLDDALQAWRTDLAVSGMFPQVLHGDATPPTEITGLVADSRVATQRRRLRG